MAQLQRPMIDLLGDDDPLAVLSSQCLSGAASGNGSTACTSAAAAAKDHAQSFTPLPCEALVYELMTRVSILFGCAAASECEMSSAARAWQRWHCCMAKGVAHVLPPRRRVLAASTTPSPCAALVVDFS
jgi:hypothetical protein